MSPGHLPSERWGTTSDDTEIRPARSMTLKPIRLIVTILAAIALILAIEFLGLDIFWVGMAATLGGAGGLGWALARWAYGAWTREKAIENGLWSTSFVCAGFAFTADFELGALGFAGFMLVAAVYSGRRHQERTGLEGRKRAVRAFYEEVVSTRGRGPVGVVYR